MSLLVLFMVFLLVFGSVFFLLDATQSSIRQYFNEQFDSLTRSLNVLNKPIDKKKYSFVNAGAIALALIVTYMVTGTSSGINQYLLDRGILLNKIGDFDGAVKTLSRIVEGKSALAHNELGYAYYSKNNRDLAIRNFEMASEIVPEYATPYLNLSVLYNEAGRTSDAAFARRRAQLNLSNKPNADRLYGNLQGERPLLVALFIFLVLMMVFIKLPIWVAKLAAYYRRRKFDEVLPDAIGVISNSMRGGLSLSHAIDEAVRQSQQPVKEEMRLVSRSIDLGANTSEAIRQMADKMDTEDAHILATNSELLTTTGGELSKSMDTLAKTMRERKRIKDKISTMTAEPKVQAIVLGIVPIILAWVMNKLQPEVFSVMYTTNIGMVISIVLIIWGILGVIFMWKVIQIKI